MNPIHAASKPIPSWLADCLILLLVLVLIVGLYWPLWATRPSDRMILAPGDLTVFFYPAQVYAIQQLQHGQIPIWTPYNLGGQPFLAQMQTLVLYPITWVLALLTWGSTLSYQGFAVEIILHLVIAAWGAFLFFRRLLHDRAAGMFGAIAWGLSGYLTGYPILQLPILASATWLSWLFWSLDHALDSAQPRRRWIILSILFWALVFMGGMPQTALYVYLAALAFALTRIWQGVIVEGDPEGRPPAPEGRPLPLKTLGTHAVAPTSANYTVFGIRPRRRYLANLALIVVFGSALTAAQALPTVEVIAWSQRATWSFMERAGGFSPWELLGVFLPRLTPWSPLYVGIPTLILALGVWWGQGERPPSPPRLWLLIAAGGVALALGAATLFFPLLYWLAPVFTLFRDQERAAVVVAWALITLGLLGWKRQLSPSVVRVLVAISILSGVLLAAFAIWIKLQDADAQPNMYSQLNSWLWPWLMGVLTLILLRSGRWARWGLVALIALDLGTVGWLTATTQQFKAIDPAVIETPPISREQAAAALPPLRIDTRGQVTGDWTGPAGLQDLHGMLVFALNEYERFRTEVPGDRVWALMGVSCFVQAKDEPPVPLAAHLVDEFSYEGKGLGFYCLNQPFTPYHVVYRSVSLDDDTALRTLAGGGFNPLETVILDSAWTGPALSAPDAPPVISAQKWAPQQTTLQVSTSKPGILVLGDLWYPGWQAYVDDAPAHIYRADTALQAVSIPSGNHQVVVRYEPFSFTLGLVISGAALAVVAVWGLGRIPLSWRGP